ncbi:unnamed protein product, partial [Schistosoma mattheei]
HHHHHHHHQRIESKTKIKRHRQPRNSQLHDLDGINELILSCSSCNPLLPFINGHFTSSLSNQKWLIMGRRIQDSNTKKYTNQLQVTFLGLWNRESIEFRQSLNAIRKESASHLCNKNQASLSNLVQPQTIQNHHQHLGRPLKILRSAPSELSDSPNYNEFNKPLSNLNLKTKLNNHHNYNYPSHLSTNQNTTNNDFSSHLNLEINNAQTTYLNEIHQLQRQQQRPQQQRPHKSRFRERRKKWKSSTNKVLLKSNSQNQYDTNLYRYQSPINPYSD